VRVLSAARAICAVAGCGGYTPGENAVDVRVRQVMDLSRNAYAEGSYSYIRVERTSGDKLLEERLPDATGHDTVWVSETVVRLDPGEYTFVSFQRPCSGDCGLLDAPTDRCDEVIRVENAMKVTVTVRPARGCVFAAD
jgi:hypothetical protein